MAARGDSYYPPFEFINDQGEPDGFNVELFRAVAEVMGLEAEIDLGPWTEVRNDLESGRIDLLVGMFYSEGRDQLVDFSTPHSIISHTIFIPRGSPIASVEDIRGKEILVQEGDIVHDYLIENHLTDFLIPVVDQREALKLLNRGYHDAAFVAKLQGLYFQEELGLSNIRTIRDTLIPQRYCFAVREGDQELLALLNEGLNIVKLNGTYEKIYDRWFGVLEQQNIFRRFRRTILLSGTGLLLVSAFLVAWTWSMRITVRRRTRDLQEEIVHRRHIEEQLAGSLAEKEVLLSEIHHRVKNNLQIINSLLELQRNSVEDSEVDQMLRASQGRIRSMALVHEQLYGEKSFSSISLESYLVELTDSIYPAFQEEAGRILLDRDLQDLEIDIDKAIPLGLIVSEIMTNSFRHAFPEGRGGRISLRCRQVERILRLELRDDGVGKEATKRRKPVTGAPSLGGQLIEALVLQLGGSLRTEDAVGTAYFIEIPLKKDPQE